MTQPHIWQQYIWQQLHTASTTPHTQLHAHRITQDACRCYVALVLVGAPVPLIRQAADALTTMLGPYGTPPFLLADTQLATMVAAARQWPVPTLQLYAGGVPDVVTCNVLHCTCTAVALKRCNACLRVLTICGHALKTTQTLLFMMYTFFLPAMVVAVLGSPPQAHKSITITTNDAQHDDQSTHAPIPQGPGQSLQRGMGGSGIFHCSCPLSSLCCAGRVYTQHTPGTILGTTGPQAPPCMPQNAAGACAAATPAAVVHMGCCGAAYGADAWAGGVAGGAWAGG